MQIRINLLPAEYRKREMTPLATLLPALLTLTVVLGAGSFWALNHFGALSRVQAVNADLESQWANRKAPLEYLAELKTEETDYEARQATIHEIAGSRVPWTLKLDQLCDLVADDDGGERYLVWLSNLKAEPPRSVTKGEKLGPVVSFDGLCYSDDHPLNRFNQFHERLKQHEFYNGDFVSINNPAGSAVNLDDDLKPARAWTVDLAMQMASRAKEKPGKEKGRRVVARPGGK